MLSECVYCKIQTNTITLGEENAEFCEICRRCKNHKVLSEWYKSVHFLDELDAEKGFLSWFVDPFNEVK